MTTARLRRTRRRGWRMPEGAIYVGRPTRWGNPFRVGVEAADAAGAVGLYREWLARPDQKILRSEIHAVLAGRDVVCWCPLDQPCHADVLLEEARR